MKIFYTFLFCLCSLGAAAQCNGAGGAFPAFGFTPGPPPIDDSKQFALQISGLPLPDSGNGELDYFAVTTAEGNVVGCGPVSSNGSVAIGNMQINFECGNTVPEALNCAATPACDNCETFQVFYYDVSTQLYYQLENTSNPGSPLEFLFVDVNDNGDGTFGDGIVDGYGATEAVSGANTEDADVSSATMNFEDFFLPLPVSFAAFTGQQAEKSIELDWVTATESGNDFFAVERSNSGSDFEEVGRVAAAGDSEVATSYEFIDRTPAEGLNYYRLRQIDADGDFSFSSVLLIDFKGADAGAMIVSPNPATNHLSVRLSGDWSAETVNGQLFGASGRLIKNWQQRPGTSSTIDLAGVPAGIYQLRMNDGKTRQIQRVIVR
ncbi:T9SS type A sorting domain-containing protein [Neolewinella aurantiaca]|uniref:T9SS type A sorting domain-containing protein n=1 Tax=Neolewinella aurantiaca TaxID=2602767 RepID=A0A5C7FXP0_9BACT|nr:T9SS type A sorting domain-containing protein [Neolewinella aurantiaca]TXF89758.1 T9SS type A sorting domain-containing protein [Neolewinella aurantiaca]